LTPYVDKSKDFVLRLSGYSLRSLDHSIKVQNEVLHFYLATLCDRLTIYLVRSMKASRRK
jgi:hypothetical protein